jgi:hypothetical protein
MKIESYGRGKEKTNVREKNTFIFRMSFVINLFVQWVKGVYERTFRVISSLQSSYEFNLFFWDSIQDQWTSTNYA